MTNYDQIKELDKQLTLEALEIAFKKVYEEPRLMLKIEND